MNPDLDGLGPETAAIVDAGIGSFDTGLSATTDITLSSDFLDESLETGLIVVNAADDVVIADKFGLVEVFES